MVARWPSQLAEEVTDVATDLGGAPRPRIDLDGPDLDGGGPDHDHLVRYGELEDLIDLLVEGFNARDMDRSLAPLSDDPELPGLGGDRNGFAEVLADCWEDRPNSILTRGLLSDGSEHDGWEQKPVAVLWDIDDEGTWCRAVLLTFDVSDDARIGLIEVADDAVLLETAATDGPDEELPEGAVWAEWSEGAELD
jgi:hypothetical protein